MGNNHIAVLSRNVDAAERLHGPRSKAIAQPSYGLKLRPEHAAVGHQQCIEKRPIDYVMRWLSMRDGAHSRLFHT